MSWKKMPHHPPSIMSTCLIYFMQYQSVFVITSLPSYKHNQSHLHIINITYFIFLQAHHGFRLGDNSFCYYTQTTPTYISHFIPRCSFAHSLRSCLVGADGKAAHCSSIRVLRQLRVGSRCLLGGVLGTTPFNLPRLLPGASIYNIYYVKKARFLILFLIFYYYTKTVIDCILESLHFLYLKLAQNI